jgi:hypothetical protein
LIFTLLIAAIVLGRAGGGAALQFLTYPDCGGFVQMKLRSALGLLIVILLLASCDVLSSTVATSGPKKYKSEVASTGQQVRREIETDGSVSEGTRKKFDAMLARWEGERGKFGSFIKLKEAQKELDLALSEPANAFNHYQFASGAISDALNVLQTEVKD